MPARPTRRISSQGALYDRGVYLYAMGYMGPNNDDMGRSVCNYIKRRMPDFQPTAILDMGCTVGHSTVPFKELFPDAEVTGIDVGGPCVRYAHARAKALGHDVAFLQRNAEDTGFADDSFDLIVSHILLHETSGQAMPRIFRECHRLLKPGGVMIHADLPPFDLMDPFTQFILDNETYYNNEPFWGAMRDKDQIAMAADAGFPAEASASTPRRWRSWNSPQRQKAIPRTPPKRWPTASSPPANMRRAAAGKC